MCAFRARGSGGKPEAIGATFASVIVADSARMGGNLHLGASRFIGPIQLDGAVVEMELRLSSMNFGRVEWRDKAALRLHNARAGALQAELPALKRTDGAWVPHDLAGRRHEQPGGLRSDTGGATPAQSAPGDLIARIERRKATDWPRPGHDTLHSPQPCMQLADAVQCAGATGEAEALRYAAREHTPRNPGPGWREWAEQRVSTVFIGDGIYPFRVPWWFGARVLAGTHSGCTALCRWGTRLWFSLENALPLVEPNTGFRALEHEHRGANLRKASRLVLPTILVGVLPLPGGP